MEETRKTFSKRVKEINLYYNVLKQLNNEVINKSLRNNVKTSKKYKQEVFLKILKANALLMIYNLVESTVLNGIQEIHNKLKDRDLPYSKVRQEIKDIWFSYKFEEAYDQESHFHTYKDKAMDIVTSIITNKKIELGKKAVNISGNLDAQQIHNVCKKHGIKFSTSKNCKGGIKLTEVRDKRNGLAHGRLSFAECGRDYSFEELLKIKKQTYLFLKGLLKGMKKYYDDEAYLDASLASHQVENSRRNRSRNGR